MFCRAGWWKVHCIQLYINVYTLLQEIAEDSGRLCQAPLGCDRFFRRFWNFNHVDGLVVESDETAPLDPSEPESEGMFNSNPLRPTEYK